MVNSLSRLAQELAEHTRRLRGVVSSVETELADCRVSARSADGAVEAVTDHRGRLVELTLPPAALTRGHGTVLGGQIVEAVNRARTLAVDDHYALIGVRARGMAP